MMRKIFRKFLIGSLVVLCLPMVALVSCQHKLIYFPRPYPATHDAQWTKETPGKVLRFNTSAGQQQAYFFRGRANAKPERLWLVCGGNGTLATEWTEFMKNEAPPEDAYLLIDYPGYGSNEGAANPAAIRESLRQSLPLAAAELQWDEKIRQQRTRIFGHSLGCAVALIGAEEFSLNRGVLLAPFTSTMDMTKEVIGVNVGFLVTHRYDNTKIMRVIAKQPNAKIHIFHGQTDGVIPASMASSLHTIAPKKFPLTLCEKSGHNELQDKQTKAIVSAMKAVQ
jgi:pimeloyl-ACP methyl ester carboxylesterase